MFVDNVCTATCNTQTDRDNDVTAEDMRTRQAGRRERQRPTLVTGGNTPSFSPVCEQDRSVGMCMSSSNFTVQIVKGRETKYKVFYLFFPH